MFLYPLIIGCRLQGVGLSKKRCLLTYLLTDADACGAADCWLDIAIAALIKHLKKIDHSQHIFSSNCLTLFTLMVKLGKGTERLSGVPVVLRAYKFPAGKQFVIA